MASGAGSPDRTVASTAQSRSATSWWTSAAEAGSRRCASSTTRRNADAAAPPTAARTRLKTPNGVRSASANGTKPTNAANGIVPAAFVPTTERTDRPAAVARAAISRATRVLPTPVVPARTTAAGAPVETASTTRSITSPRPTSGQSSTAPL
jgi:hypothetical protein